MKDDRGDGLAEGRGGFLVLLIGLANVGHKPWCSRGPFRAPVAEISRWEATRTWAIDSPEWTGVRLNALHARPVRIELGCCEGYRPGGLCRPCVPGGLLMTSSKTAFGHRPIRRTL